jgi:hypothetical protein
MTIDFEALKSTPFYKLGRVLYDPESDSIIESPMCFYYAMNHTMEDIRAKKNEPLSTERWNHPSPPLHKFLSDSLPSNLKQVILDQWIEVGSIVEGLGVKPITAHFVILPAGKNVITHRHMPICKHILTFMYRFMENSINTYDSSYLDINRKVQIYPDTDKVCFSIYDNLPHSSVSNEWRFFWVYDFDQYVNVPSDIDFLNMSERRQND